MLRNARGVLPLLIALLLQEASAQRRCKLAEVRQPDGSFRLGFCDELLLHGERIGDDGATALAPALADNQRLKLLDLWSNGLGPKGVEAIA